MNFQERIRLLITYQPIVIACLLSWFSAQFIKTLIKLFTGKVNSIRELFEFLFWSTGGMPSSHSSVVATLCTTIGFHSGLNSDVFALALVFYFVTLRDALGVRRSSGIQASTLNKLSKELSDKKIIEKNTPIKEIQGHRPREVFVGSLLGFFIGLAFSI